MKPIIIKPQGIGCEPINADLNPSIRPAIGYNPYHNATLGPYFSDNKETGHTTGAAYKSNWTKNIIACLISLYWIAKAESQIPAPAALINIKITKRGNQKIFMDGIML